jgi:hypothetical protein
MHVHNAIVITRNDFDDSLIYLERAKLELVYRNIDKIDSVINKVSVSDFG